MRWRLGTHAVTLRAGRVRPARHTGRVSDTPARPGTGPLSDAVREIETYAAGAGWDRPARLFALADTPTLLAREPTLARALGVDHATAPPLTPVEQDPLPAGAALEDLLATIGWPPDVAGCALVVERLVLPPTAEADLPTDPDDAEALEAAAATHRDRQDVRIVVGVLRDGSRQCALRLRAHDTAAEVLTGPDLVPTLATALLATLR